MNEIIILIYLWGKPLPVVFKQDVKHCVMEEYKEVLQQYTPSSPHKAVVGSCRKKSVGYDY